MGDRLHPWPAHIGLRNWQIAATAKMRELHKQGTFLACATPGAGKTTFALHAAHLMLSRGFVQRVVCVTPTTHIYRQWSRAAGRVGIDLEPGHPISRGREPRDRHGIAITYAGLATDPAAQARIIAAVPTLVILDEPHHAGEDSSWGGAVEAALSGARFKILITGTPWRTSGEPISFVHYDGDECVPDFEYGYRDALRDGVVRPIAFKFFEGDLAWEADGETHSASFADNVSRIDAGRRLRSAISDGPWMGSVLERAHARLSDIRASEDPRAGGLVICESKAHAERMTDRLRAMLGDADAVTCVTSDHDDATKRIGAFAESSAPWVVAVAMISEGVDIPRLRVGAWATPIRTELHFAQAVGRLVRRTAQPHGDQLAHVFLPADPALRAHAKRYEEDRRYILAEREFGQERIVVGEAHESTFQALSGNAHLEAVVVTGGAVAPPAVEDVPMTPAEEREALRAKRKGLIAAYAKRHRVGHRQANIDANRAIGIRSVTDASADQLRAANAWLAGRLR